MCLHVATERQSSFADNETTTGPIFSARTKLGLVSPSVSWDLRNAVSYIDINAEVLLHIAMMTQTLAFAVELEPKIFFFFANASTLSPVSSSISSVHEIFL
jgi:hypothetical protein